ncbi:hypothetical protein WMY93_010457 [Mugilogobius chulae]|uniref:Protein-serine/threonine phosphatase n=1 Tax=Mugilogobius chulae TaxID=88201 RepID=A0AAW0PJW4_9GOBI
MGRPVRGQTAGTRPKKKDAAVSSHHTRAKRSDGKFNVNTGASFYRDTRITYFGVEAFDMPSFDISPFFYPAANFIKSALSSATGKVLVHCAMGLSRSSSLVLAYLMIHEGLTLVQALKSREEPYEAPPTCALLDILLKNRHNTGAVNQVWPRLYLSNTSVAKDKTLLQDLGVTHIVNAAHGPQRIDTGAGYYDDVGVAYLGVESDDSKDFNISVFFRETAEFIDSALCENGMKDDLVKCSSGSLRSWHQSFCCSGFGFSHDQTGLSLMEAVTTVRTHRNILPNAGFLNQLRELDTALHRHRTEQT